MKFLHILLLGAALLMAAPTSAQEDSICQTREAIQMENPAVIEGFVYADPSDVNIIKTVLVELGVPAESISATLFVVYVDPVALEVVVLAGFTPDGCMEGGVAMPMPLFEMYFYQEIERNRA